MNQPAPNLLDVLDLRIAFANEGQDIPVVDTLSLTLKKGEILGLVGESGCGKSVTALGILRLLPQPIGKFKGGQIFFDSTDLLAAPVEHLQKIRGRRIAMIFQEPMSALNPVLTIGAQITEMFQIHEPATPPQTQRLQAIQLLRRVGIPAAEQRFDNFPHQLSGGMRQRVMIAMALALRPDILIADEPTTALDVTIQAQILDLLKELQKDYQLSLIFISHDLGVIHGFCNRVAVMYAGEIVESASVQETFTNPRHPYTRGLLASIPSLHSQPKHDLPTIPGQVPTSKHWGQGCRFVQRCSFATEICSQKHPDLFSVNDAHTSRCHHWRTLPPFEAHL